MQESSDKEDKEEDDNVVVESDLPVDRGYAWVVLCASSMILFLLLGALKCFGVFYVEVARQYNVSSKEIQSIQSLTGFFYLGLGPVANVLSMRFSNRIVIFVGGFLCGTGFLLTSFASSLGYFYVTYGCITGFGYGLTFSPCIVSFVNYFNKKRSIANGIMMGGGGLGAVLLPFLMRYLIDVMTFQGCMMIFAGILYNICVFACLLRPHSNFPTKKRVLKKVGSKMYRSENSMDQQSLTLMDGGDLIHSDDKSFMSVDDGRSQNSFVSEGDLLLRHSCKRSKRGSKLANASIISLKSFNPSLYTNPDNMTKSICSEDQLSVDLTGKFDKQMNASVISLKSFDPSVCSNVDTMGRSIYSEEQHNTDSVDKQMNASVISLKSFDPSMNSTVDALGKSIYSDDQQSFECASLGESSRKHSLGIDSIDESLVKESFGRNKFNTSITESQTEEMGDETKSSTSKGNDQRSLNIDFSDTKKPILKSQNQGKRRHLSDGTSSMKALSTCDKLKLAENYKSKTEDSLSLNSVKTEKESLLKSVAWLQKDDRTHLNSSVISLRSFEPSLYASIGVLASISMQSLPQHVFGSENIYEKKYIESSQEESTRPCFSLKQLFLSMDWSLFRNPVFLLYLVFVFCQALGYLCLFNILPPYCEEINASDTEGASIISVISMADLFGRVFFGWLNQKCQRFHRVIYFLCCLLMGIGIVLTPLATTFTHLAILCGIYGVFTGGYNSVLFTVIVNSIGLEKFSHAFGFIAFSAALSLLLNPFESGLIKDITGSWANAFRINGAVAIFGCFMLPVIAFLEIRKRKPSQAVEIEMDTSVDL